MHSSSLPLLPLCALLTKCGPTEPTRAMILQTAILLSSVPACGSEQGVLGKHMHTPRSFARSSNVFLVSKVLWWEPRRTQLFDCWALKPGRYTSWQMPHRKPVLIAGVCEMHLVRQMLWKCCCRKHLLVYWTKYPCHRQRYTMLHHTDVLCFVRKGLSWIWRSISRSGLAK